jgi:hypothetical protein
VCDTLSKLPPVIVPPVSFSPVFTSLFQTVTSVPLFSASILLAVPPLFNSINITSAIQLIGSETRTENTIEIGIDYNDLENIPAVTFEDITSNKAQYDYTVTYYATSTTANSEKIKKKTFTVPGGTDIVATYTHVTSGYNKIVLSGGTPASITKKTKQYAYTDGKQTAVTYT